MEESPRYSGPDCQNGGGADRDPKSVKKTCWLVIVLQDAFAGGDDDAAKGVVGAKDRGFNSVDPGFPSGIPEIGENDHAGRLHVKFNGDVRGQFVSDADGSLRGLIELRDRRFHVGDVLGIKIGLGEQLKAELRIADFLDVPRNKCAGQEFSGFV